jgi:hypothetical protein
MCRITRSTQVVPEIALPVETNDGGDGDDDDDEVIEPSTPRYARPPIQLKERDENPGVEAPEVRNLSPFASRSFCCRRRIRKIISSISTRRHGTQSAVVESSLTSRCLRSFILQY